ncbi:MAG: bifunctional [glutamate--ammonia ligase]-adenylyl-L-tyrosine phosphorylase/[glutamate--ammonia-ligase] adenylyltransferase [Panacagrimonas sp.]
MNPVIATDAVVKEIETALDRACASSRFVGTMRDRGRREALVSRLRMPRDGSGIAGEVQAVATRASDEAALMRGLRELRNLEMARIAVRALALDAALDETLGDLSDLAGACLSSTVEWVFAKLEKLHGTPRDVEGQPVRPAILGMGKLGGRELNFSSDIDLIFLHSADGVTDSNPPLENERFFVKLAQDTGKILSTQTEHGFVFRVDTMLRPFGSAGPMSIGFDAAEDYYQNHGREWERYALVKARPVAGDIAAGEALLQSLRPFVYRRYLDFNAIGSLRDLKRRIHDDVVARRVTDDVKLGPGGIRELEFIVQSFQLVRGGQDVRLRTQALRPTLKILGELGLLPVDTVAELDDSYVFLRTLENAIQIFDDRQTHRLPADEQARAALCFGLGFADWETLRARFDAVAAFVNEEFRRVFAEPARSDSEHPCAAAVRFAFDPGCKVGELALALAGSGFGDATQGLAQRLFDLIQSRIVRGLSESAAQTLRRVLGQVLQECLSSSEAVRSAERVLIVIQAVAGRSTYLTLLDESAVVRSHLVRLCAASQWVTEQIAASPAVLDVLLDPRTLYAPPGRGAMRTELAGRLASIPVDDIETGMDALRRYRNETTVRTAAADIGEILPLVKVSDQLTWLAEAVLTAALDRANLEMREQYGQIMTEMGTVAGLGAIAYGKFGGIELGYGSDLDLVFVHENVSHDAESSGGVRALPATAWFARLAQRVIHWLATLTPAGRAYEIDMELRPSGQSGPIVTGFKGLARYQREQAWTWEHQALTRARFVAGPATLGEAFEALRREILCRPRDTSKLAQEIVDMRHKMRTHLETRRPGTWDLKHGRGGVIDCEFLTQYLVLRDAATQPELVKWSDNWRQLDALAQAGSLPAEDRDGLIASYRAYRAFAHACALQSQQAIANEAEFVQERALVAAAWNRQFEGIEPKPG